MVGFVQGVLGVVQDLTHHDAGGVIREDLPRDSRRLRVRPGHQRRAGQLQLEVIKARQLQLAAEHRYGGHSYLAHGAQVRDADILCLLLVLKHIVDDLPFRFCEVFILQQHQRHNVFSHRHPPPISCHSALTAAAYPFCAAPPWGLSTTSW